MKIALGILIGLLSWETCNKRDSKITYNYWCYSCWRLYLSLILSLLCNIFYRLNEHLCCSRWLAWWGNPDLSWFSYLYHILAYVFVHLTVKLVTIASRDTAVYHWSTNIFSFLHDVGGSQHLHNWGHLAHSVHWYLSLHISLWVWGAGYDQKTFKAWSSMEGLECYHMKTFSL